MQGAFKFLQNVEGKGRANDVVDKKYRSVSNPVECLAEGIDI
jgi:hypothetical protein